MGKLFHEHLSLARDNARMPPTDSVTSETHFGLECLRIQTRHSVAIVALHGGQLLSWTPHGERDVFWRSAIMQAPPAALRGGVPVCWPWFGNNGPAGSPSHGHARTSMWELAHFDHSATDSVDLTLRPRADSFAASITGLSITQTFHFADSLTQTLVARNVGPTPFALTQALHSYFAVADASRIRIEGIAGATYFDKLLGQGGLAQTTPFDATAACDRVYHGVSGAYQLADPVWRRRIVIESTGSQSLVVWNPGAERSRAISDLEPAAWRDFYCLEVANAGPDAVLLAPGTQHRLSQTIRLQSWPVDA